MTTDARLWHPWLRINRVLRAMLHGRWPRAAACPIRATLPERDAATRREGRMRFVTLLLIATALTA
jgi:hypothetical protein